MQDIQAREGGLDMAEAYSADPTLLQASILTSQYHPTHSQDAASVGDSCLSISTAYSLGATSMLYGLLATPSASTGTAALAKGSHWIVLSIIFGSDLKVFVRREDRERLNLETFPLQIYIFFCGIVVNFRDRKRQKEKK